MPLDGPPREYCPKCTKPVYTNEAKLGANAKWHPMCFKCDTCNKILESTTSAENGGKLYCKFCYGKSFGPKGYGAGGAGTLSVEGDAHKTSGGVLIRGEAVEGGCPRCGRRVYEAEKRTAANKDWHKSCLNCNLCHRSLDSTTANENAGEVYCRNCYGKHFAPVGKK
jgi:cysteine/glycine-rich protein